MSEDQRARENSPKRYVFSPNKILERENFEPMSVQSPVKKATVIIGVFKSPDKNWVLAVRLAKIFHCVYLRIGI